MRSWNSSRDGSLDARSNSSASRTPRQMSSLDESALERYQEARRRAEAAVSTAATSAAVPSSIRNIHEFVKLAAQRHEARENASVLASDDSSVDGQDHADIMQAEKAAEESLLYRRYEERIFEAGLKIQDLRVELVAAAAQEAAQSSEWQDRYDEEVQAVRQQCQRVVDIEELAASKVDLSTAKHVELGRLRKEAAESEEIWKAERRKMLQELQEAKDAADLSRVRTADYEMQVRQSTEAVAKAARESSSYTEALEMSRAQQRMANLQTQAADASLMLSIEKELQMTALSQSLKAEKTAMLAGEANTVEMLQAETRKQASLASEFRQEISELRATNLRNEKVLRQLEDSENARKRDHEAAKDLHTDASLLMDHLSKFVDNFNTDKEARKGFNRGETMKDGTSIVEAVKNVQDHIMERRRKAVSVEEIAHAESTSETAISQMFQHASERLKAELFQESQDQRTLHGELMVLSSAAASARALVAAKDASIAECEAASQRLVSEIAVARQEQDLNKSVGSFESVKVMSEGSAEDSTRPSSATGKRAPTKGIVDRAFSARVTPRNTCAPDRRSLSSTQRPTSREPEEKTDWKRLASSAGTTSIETCDSEQDNASSVNRGRASSNDTTSALSSVSEKVRFQSTGLSFGKAAMSPSRAAPQSNENIPGVFAKFRAALKRAESNAAPATEQNPERNQNGMLERSQNGIAVDSSATARERAPNWEYTQKVMTDQLRHDLCELRQVFTKFGADGKEVPQERPRSPVRMESTRVGVAASRTRSPPAPTRVQLRSATVDVTTASPRSPQREVSRVSTRNEMQLSKACRTVLRREQSVSHSVARSKDETQKEPLTSFAPKETIVETLQSTSEVSHRGISHGRQEPVSVKRPVMRSTEPGVLSPRESAGPQTRRGSVPLLSAVPNEVNRATSSARPSASVATSPTRAPSQPTTGPSSQWAPGQSSAGRGSQIPTSTSVKVPAQRSQQVSQPPPPEDRPHSASLRFAQHHNASSSSPAPLNGRFSPSPVAPQYFMPSLPTKR